MSDLQKIIVVNREFPDKTKLVGYLVEVRPTKFIILNETKKLTLHFPTKSYTYEDYVQS